MPNDISRWVKKHILPRPKNDDRFPSLPCPRARPITPPGDAPATATALSPLFTRLPAEIRRQILVQAFGATVMHMDLVFDHPPLPTHDTTLNGPIPKIPVEGGGYYHPANYHCNRLVPRPRRSNLASYRRVDDSRPRRWQWFGSVCHSTPPTVPPSSMCRWYRLDEPCADTCRDGDPLCYVWPGETPRHCFVGATGWLRTCRQAYVEGIEVLYATNTFRVRDMVILRRAKDLFVPHRWASMRHLEVTWCLRPWGPPERPIDGGPPPAYSDLESYRTMLEEMPGLLPRLKTLYISLQGGMKGGDVWGSPPMEEGLSFLGKLARRGEIGIETLLQPMEAMMRRLPTDVESSIAVPSSMYVLLRDEAVREGRSVERMCLGQRERCWRETEGRGYWLRLGQVDLPSMRVPMVCGLGAAWVDDDPTPEEDKVLYDENYFI